MLRSRPAWADSPGVYDYSGPRYHSPSSLSTRSHGQRDRGPVRRDPGVVAIQPTAQPSRLWQKEFTHQHRYNKPAGLTTGAKEGYNKGSEKFATNWAKARADNADMFSRSTSDTMGDAESRRHGVGLPKINTHEGLDRKNNSANSLGRVSSHIRGNSQKGTISDPGRLSFNNTWAKVRRQRKALRDAGLKSETKTSNSNPPGGEHEDHQPYVNDLKQVTKLYTAMTVGASQYPREGNGRGMLHGSQSNPESLHSEKRTAEYILSRREAQTYHRITKVYDGDSDYLKRQNRFYQKLEDLQTECEKLNTAENVKKKREREESKKRQQKQLQIARERYFSDKMRRFTRQHVSRKIVEADEEDRHQYGLPEVYQETENREVAERSPKKRTASNPEERKKRNMQKFGFLFAIRFKQNVQNRAKRRPKMEGIDTVLIEEQTEGDVVKERKYSVQDIIKDAQQCLRQPTPTDLVLSHRRGQGSADSKGRQSLDLEDEDLFEKARKKYGLDVDSEEEDLTDRKYL